MADKKRIAMLSGTAACILATGFFMQGGLESVMSSGGASGGVPVSTSGMIPTDLGAANTPEVSDSIEIAEVELTAADNEVLSPPAATQSNVQTFPQADQPIAQPARSVDQPVTVSLLDQSPAEPAVITPAPRQEPKLTEQCEISMTGVEVAGALVKLSLEAPCMPNERVTMHHNGMMFTEVTGSNGEMNLTVPALAKTAVFIASFSNGEGAVANVNMTSLDLFDRAVVQSEFVTSVGLHALEFTTDYSSRGHVWALATGDIADAASGNGGFMTLLGNPAVRDGTMAQVYTFPSGMAAKSGDVTLSVEIEVTDANCGVEVEAQSLQVSRGGQPKVQTLDMTMPDCDAVGDFLVLKNLVNDLKVAANN